MGSISSDGSSARSAQDLAEVCTLSPEGLAERIAWVRREILPHAIHSERLPTGIAWELDAAPGLVEKLDRLVTLERECCDGIVFEHGRSAQPGRLRLEVRGVNPDAEAFRSLREPPAKGVPSGSRLAKAAGIGFVASLAVCCALPLVAGVIFGGAFATAVARLDQPWLIALVSIALGAVAWWWLGRRARSSAGCGAQSGVCGRSC